MDIITDEWTGVAVAAAAGLAVLGVVVTVLILRCLWIVRQIQQIRLHSKGRGSARQPLLLGKTKTTHKRTLPCKTLVVLGSGGHTSEMLHMVQQLDPKHYHPMEFVVADTDHTSVKRLQALLLVNNNNKKGGGDNGPQQQQQQQQQPIIHRIPRSREVGQSYLSSIFTTIYALIHAIGITFVQIRPQLVLCNGPGTCVPIIMGAWILRILGFSCHFIFVESFCRVQTLSLTGKILYHNLVDTFVVHWESLHSKYPNSYLSTTFVSNHHNKTK